MKIAARITLLICMVLAFVLMAMVVVAQPVAKFDVEKMASDHWFGDWTTNPYEDREGFIVLNPTGLHVLINPNEKWDEESMFFNLTSSRKTVEENAEYVHKQFGEITISEYHFDISSPTDGRTGEVHIIHVFKDSKMIEWNIDIFLKSEIYKPQRISFTGTGIELKKDGKVIASS